MQKRFRLPLKENRYRLLAFFILLLLFFALKRVGAETEKGLMEVAKPDACTRNALFFSYEKDMREADIKSLRNEIYENYLIHSGKPKEEVLSCIYDTYMGITKLTFERKNNYYEAEVYVVGDHYFSFHSSSFLSGGAFLQDADTQNNIILSRSLAFQIFGSVDVCQKELMCNGKVLIVSGVVEDDNTLFDLLAGNEKAIAYLPYASAVEEVGNTPVISYEAAMSEPLDGFAKKILSAALHVDRYQRDAGLENAGIKLISQTERFRLSGILKRMVSFGERLLQKKAFVYPRWENRARLLEFWLFLISLFLIIDFFCLAFSFLSAGAACNRQKSVL